MKNTWITIKQILNRTGKNGKLPEAFFIDNVPTSDPSVIANKFNVFFAEVGVRLTVNFDNADNVNFRDYLLNLTIYNFDFKLISEETTMEALNNLKPEHRCGHDGISTKLLKTCKHAICKPLTLIINQMLSTGIFPDNYRPISILPSIYKIFERIIFDQMHAHFTSRALYYNGQYGFFFKAARIITLNNCSY